MGVNSIQWYYMPALAPIGQTAILDGEEWHHCLHVMRMRSGDHLILCDGKGNCMEGIVKTAESKEGEIEFIRDLSNEFKNQRSYRVSIAMAPTKNIDRIEFAVEKLVEIGVDEIYFLNCDHNERTRLRLDRMQKIAIAAAKQSRKLNFTLMFDMMTPAKCIETFKKQYPGKQLMVCHLDEDSKSISENYSPGNDVLLLIGPEGGFSKNELEEMARQNVKSVHLGPFRLRVETAAIVACAGIHLINQS